MVINRLQLAKGGKEYLCNLKSARAQNLQFVDYEAHAKSMGAEAETVTSTSELEAAFKRAKKSKKSAKGSGLLVAVGPPAKISGVASG